MDIKKYLNIKNLLESVIGVIIGLIFGDKFITFLLPYMINDASAHIAITTGIYAPLIAIVTGIILFFGIRTLAYLISAMFLGAGIGIAIFDISGVDIYSSLITMFHMVIAIL
ncbi:MAG: hypothetical protein QXZ44_01445 [Ferroplasma sp.]